MDHKARKRDNSLKPTAIDLTLESQEPFSEDLPIWKKESAAARRFRLLRAAKLRRAKMLDHQDDKTLDLFAHPTANFVDEEKALEPVPPAPRILRDLRDNKAKARSRKHKVGKHHQLATYLRALEDDTSDEREASTLSEQTAKAGLEDLHPDSLLYKFATGKMDAREMADRTMESQRRDSDYSDIFGDAQKMNVNKSDPWNSDEIDDEYSSEGIFGLTGLGESEFRHQRELPQTDSEGRVEDETERQDNADDNRSVGTHQSQLTIHRQGSHISLGPLYPLSKQGRALAKTNNLGRKAKRRQMEEAIREEDMAPAEQQLGRASHVGDDMNIICLEVDVVKFITLREKVLQDIKECYADLRTSIVAAREERDRVESFSQDLEKLEFARKKKRTGKKDSKPNSNINTRAVVAEPTINTLTTISESLVNESDSTAKMYEKVSKVHATSKRRLLSLKRKVGDLQDRFRELIPNFRSATADVTQAILAWRSAIRDVERARLMKESFPVFDFQGQNYLEKMRHDILFLKRGLPTEPALDCANDTFVVDADNNYARCSPSKPELLLHDDDDANSTDQDWDSSVEISAEALIYSWIGLDIVANPILLPPENFDVYCELDKSVLEADKKQQNRKKNAIHELIRSGLGSGKSAHDILEDISPSVPTPAAFTRAATTSRANYFAAGRDNSHLRRDPTLSTCADEYEDQNNNSDDDENDHLVHSGKGLMSPLSARAYKSEGDPSSSSTETFQALTVPESGQGGLHNKSMAVVPATVKDSSASLWATDDDFENTKEYKNRHFNFSLAPRTNLIPPVPSEQQPKTQGGYTARALAECRDIILKEEQEMARVERAKNEERERWMARYDPLANVEARGGQAAIMDCVENQLDSSSSMKVVLRRRQEEGNPQIVDEDPPGGHGGLPLRALHTEKRRLVTEQPSMGNLEKTQRERKGIALMDATLVKGLTFRKAVPLVEKKERDQVRTGLLEKLHTLRRLESEKDNLSVEQVKEMKELRLQVDLLRSGFLPAESNQHQYDSSEAEGETSGTLCSTANLTDEKHVQAAVTVQSFLRMSSTRRQFLHQLELLEQEEAVFHMSVQELAVISIQACFRGFQLRKRLELEEASAIMERELKREQEEKKRLERLKALQMQELMDRGRKRRHEIEIERDQKEREQAAEASRKAQAAKVLSRQFRAHLAKNKAKLVHCNSAATKIQQHVRRSQAQRQRQQRFLATQFEKASIKIQAVARGHLTRSFFRELRAAEKERIREEYVRKRERERYAKLYTGSNRDGAKVSLVARDVRKVKTAVHFMLPLIQKQGIGKNKISAVKVDKPDPYQEKLAQAALDLIKLPSIGPSQTLHSVAGNSSPKEGRRTSQRQSISKSKK